MLFPIYGVNIPRHCCPFSSVFFACFFCLFSLFILVCFLPWFFLLEHRKIFFPVCCKIQFSNSQTYDRLALRTAVLSPGRPTGDAPKHFGVLLKGFQQKALSLLPISSKDSVQQMGTTKYWNSQVPSSVRANEST